MTPSERSTELKKLFDKMPYERLRDKERFVCGVLYCSRTTLQIWRCISPSRTIPESKLKILTDAMRRRGFIA